VSDGGPDASGAAAFRLVALASSSRTQRALLSRRK
jgi:hypothetical protein